MDGFPLKDDARGISFNVRVVPGAKRTEVGGRRGDAIVIRVASRPVDGKANDALVAFLSSTFDRPKRDIAIVSGLASRAKRVTIANITRAQAVARLSTILPA